MIVTISEIVLSQRSEINLVATITTILLSEMGNLQNYLTVLQAINFQRKLPNYPALNLLRRIITSKIQQYDLLYVDDKGRKLRNFQVFASP